MSKYPTVAEMEAMLDAAMSYDNEKFNALCDQLDGYTGKETRPLRRVLSIGGVDYRINDLGIAFSLWQGQLCLGIYDTVKAAVRAAEVHAQ